MTRPVNWMTTRVQSLMVSDGLKARCARGGAALAAGTMAERGARLVRNIILARILAPDQFGLMALVMAASQLFEALTEVGVRQSVVQNKRGDTPEFLNVAWWFSAVRGSILYAAGFVAAPWVASFYGQDALTPLLRVAFLTMLFSGLTSPRLYVLEKHLQFGRYVWIVQGASLAGTIISLLMVLAIPNVWALVAGFVAEAAIRSTGSFVVCPIRPRLQFDRQCSRELMTFAGGMFGLPILAFIAMKADVFVLGKITSPETLGLYAMALVLADVPAMIFSRVAAPMVLPILSNKSDQPRQFGEAILRTMHLILTFGTPLGVCLAMLAQPILVLTYGDCYSSMGSTFAVLSVYFLVYILNAVIMSAYMALGRPDVHRQFAILRVFLLAVTLYPAGVWFGTFGVALALLFCVTLASTVQLRNLHRSVGIGMWDYVATGRHGIVAGLAAVPLAWMIVRIWNGRPGLQVAAGAATCILVWGGGWFLRSGGMRLAEPMSAERPIGLNR